MSHYKKLNMHNKYDKFKLPYTRNMHNKYDKYDKYGNYDKFKLPYTKT